MFWHGIFITENECKIYLLYLGFLKETNTAFPILLKINTDSAIMKNKKNPTEVDTEFGIALFPL